MTPNVVGWNKIIPQLVVFFTMCKSMANEEFSIMNLFVHGKIGVNKTAGMQALVRHLGYSVGLIDSGTLDEISELAGVPDIHANRTEGRAAMILGSLIQNDVLILDETLNIRPHVLPQLRLLLQKKLSLMGSEIPLGFKIIIGTGNLDKDMQAGVAQVFDSPTADRFLCVIEIPGLEKMEPEEKRAIIEGKSHSGFIDEFTQAMRDTVRVLPEVVTEFGDNATTYVVSLAGALLKTPYEFQGRRAKLLREAILVLYALCKAQPYRKFEKVLLTVVNDILRYHALCGMEMKEDPLKNAHEKAFELLTVEDVESRIIVESSFEMKISLMLANLQHVSLATRISLMSRLMENENRTDSRGVWVAAHMLLDHPIFEDQEEVIKDIITKTPLPQMAENFRLTPQDMVRKLSQAEILALQLSDGDRAKSRDLLNQADLILKQWGV